MFIHGDCIGICDRCKDIKIKEFRSTSDHLCDFKLRFFVIILGVLTPLKINFVIILIAVYFCWATFYGFYFTYIKVLDPREEAYTSGQEQHAKLNTAMHGLGTYTVFFPFSILMFFYKKV